MKIGVALTIRPARPADAPTLREIIGQAWQTSYSPIVGATNVDQMADTLLNDMSLRRLIVDSSFDTPIAMCAGAPAATAMARLVDNYLHVMRLYVLPAFQGQGVGVALLNWLLARQRIGIAVRLEVVAANHGALRFYDREGFVDIGGGREIIGGVPFDIRRLERRGH